MGTHAIANTGATSFFVMEGTPMSNEGDAPNPLNIPLPNGKKVKSTKICNITIPGLPVMLTGHILPGLSMAPLMGICILCKAGCIVVFLDTTCEVIYNKQSYFIRGFKDPTTDLWMLPITPAAIIKTSKDLLDSPIMLHLLEKGLVNQKNPCRKECVGFIHSIMTWANTVKFAQQSLCNPKKSSLLKATRNGFLKRCPNLSE
jgi:hypothetical protein